MSWLLARLLRRSDRLEDWVPWWLTLDGDAEVILTSSGGLLSAAALELHDLDTAGPETLVRHSQRIAAVFGKRGSGVTIYLDQWRVEALGYLPEGDFGGNLAARWIDASRRAQFTDRQRPVFENHPFLAVHYTPQRRDEPMNWLLDRQDGGAIAGVIAAFKESVDALFRELAQVVRGVTVLRGDDLASYLAPSVTYRPGLPTMMPRGMLAPQFAAAEWRTAPFLVIDGRHLATVEIHNWGSPAPVTMEPLHELPFEARWVTTFHCLDLDRQRAEIERVRKDWRSRQKGLGSYIDEIRFKQVGAGRTNPEADQALAQLDAMQAHMVETPFAMASCNVHVWADSRAEAADRAGHVAGLLNARGLLARVATLNATMAPLSDMPGNVTRDTVNARQARIELEAIAKLSPLTGVSPGAREDWRFGGPALLVALTARSVPFYWSLNAPGSDSAHTAIIGRTGSGKSALIAFMVAQFLRYQGARAIVFDRGRSFWVPCLCLGGDWIELGAGRQGVQPLRRIDLPAELAWAQGWLTKALRLRGCEPVQAALTEALGHVRDYPEDERTLTALYSFLSDDPKAREALRYYLRGGPHGTLFDGVVASYGDAPVIGIETIDLAGMGDIAPLAVAAIFRALRRDRFVGDGPKLAVIDESGIQFRDEDFAAEAESWVRELRKLKAALVLSTQSLVDFAQGRGRVIFDQLGNRVYLPHAEALRPQTRELYERVGLTVEQIEALSRARPKADYLIQTEEVLRLATIRLEGDALAICGASSPSDHARARELLERGVAPGEDFTRTWLAQSTAAWRQGRAS
jgi:type IV secretion system protein VirB4